MGVHHSSKIQEHPLFGHKAQDALVLLRTLKVHQTEDNNRSARIKSLLLSLSLKDNSRRILKHKDTRKICIHGVEQP